MIIRIDNFQTMYPWSLGVNWTSTLNLASLWAFTALRFTRGVSFAEEKKAVEDKFLKLSDMEKFLDRADAEDAGIAEEEDDDAEALSEDDEDDDDEDLEVNCYIELSQT